MAHERPAVGANPDPEIVICRLLRRISDDLGGARSTRAGDTAEIVGGAPRSAEITARCSELVAADVPFRTSATEIGAPEWDSRGTP